MVPSSEEVTHALIDVSVNAVERRLARPMAEEGAAIVRVQVVEETADRIIEKWGRMLQEKIKGEA